ncbi:type IV pilus modification PilV family protein [Pyxidicoccus xibeiensis]|uniref:type IV pilus modification PilV family protein n=1 Tax=Pyxidicoccus xibeiensis TaxID=2906759 RepID=UPI0020A71C12|nr:prepilin cleavage protein [Pyxidicoccus xibeiensis]MCP3138954.1 prepilin cleavage protein [Pyxidicoccus xibeiensis]
MKPLNDSSSRRRAAMRGATLIEGMAAAAVLALGISGVFAGLILASQQNVDARRLSQASAIATQIRSGIHIHGYTRLKAAGGPLTTGRCTADAETRALAGGLESIAGTCVVDLDAYEDAVAPDAVLVPAYSSEERDAYRRVLVWNALGDIDSVAAVVSFRSAGQRRYVKQFIGVYEPRQNVAGVTP